MLGITVVNGPLIIIGQGPFPVSTCKSLLSGFLKLTRLQQVIAGLTDIVSHCSTIIAQSQGSQDSKNAQEAKQLLVKDVTVCN